MLDFQARHVGRARQRVIHQRAREELSVGVVDQSFPRRSSKPLRERPMNLPFNNHWVEGCSAIFNGDVAQGLEASGVWIGFDDRDVNAVRAWELMSLQIVRLRRFEGPLQ